MHALTRVVTVLRRSPASVVHQDRHHAVVLTELSLDTLLDQEFEGRHRSEHVQNSKVSYVQYLIGRNEKKFDYINHVVKRFRFRSMRIRAVGEHSMQFQKISYDHSRSI